MKSPAVGKTKNVKMAMPLKYLSNIWTTFEMHLISCKINPIFTWSANCVITNSTGAKTFPITDAKLYIPVVTLLTGDNIKLLKQNYYLYYLTDTSFQGANILFVSSFGANAIRKECTGFFFFFCKIRNYKRLQKIT